MPEVKLGLEAVLTIDGTEITNVKKTSLEKLAIGCFRSHFSDYAKRATRQFVGVPRRCVSPEDGLPAEEPWGHAHSDAFIVNLISSGGQKTVCGCP